jgi:hypothetical protein
MESLGVYHFAGAFLLFGVGLGSLHEEAPPMEVTRLLRFQGGTSDGKGGSVTTHYVSP